MFEREQITIDIQVASRSLLVIADTWFPGWIAFVDGEEREIVRANALFRGVFVEPGDREVRMVYRPKSFRTGLTWTVSTAFLLFVLVAGVLAKRPVDPAVSAD